MIFEIPVLVEPEAGEGVVYRVRPLFFDWPERTDRNLSNALLRLAQQLEKDLDAMGRRGEHQQLAAWTFSPDADLHWLKLRLDLRGEMFRGQFPVVTFRQLDRTLAFSPWLDEVWFEVPRPKELAQHAAEVYTRWFRKALKDREEETVREILQRFEGTKKPWLTLVELSVTTRTDRRDADTKKFALLDAASVGSGAEELDAVGRCQDHLYPDGLSRAVCRDGLVEELGRMLDAGDRRPVMLVGPPMVGKTALIHEYIFRRAERRAAQEEQVSRHEENVWLLAPQRLISGMSYVGQWENRLLAILKEAEARRHILYFDDLLGLYHAGVTSRSELSVADVLKPYVERREVRVLAEATPEQLRAFRERDRGFADMFQVVEVGQPGETENLRILLGVARTLESRYRMEFDLDVLPAVIELARYWLPDAAFPGKAAVWLNRLAVKNQGGRWHGANVMADFEATSGLRTAFVNTCQTLARPDVIAAIRERIIGQAAAVEAMADVVCVAKARLNDRQRPLGTLFFLGPTGVGKTECAKALAQYLFGDAARLVRFDMNEYVSPQSVARLVGTFDQPEGLLAAAVRRQPFCVLLLDEIEKAHPDVFDLLLQILGEARLTDSLGRTASFANAVVILTSNLGTRQAARDVGFAPPGAAAGSVYLKAVEDFFRPEFLNRLDRIVPFERLERGELEQIARAILADVVAREGLVRRKCAIELGGEALAWIVDRGYHRTLGARAMRRAVEHELVRPMARQLAAITPDVPTVMTARRGGEGLAVRVTPLVEAPRRPELARPERIDDAQAMLVQARAVLDRLQPRYEAHRPPMQEADGRISPRYHWYLGVTEFLRETRGLAAAIAEDLAGPRRGQTPPLIAPKHGRSRYGSSPRYLPPDRQILKEIHAALDVVEYVKGLGAVMERQSPDERQGRLQILLERLALADALAPGEAGWPPKRALVLVRGVGEFDSARRILAERLSRKYGEIHPCWGRDDWHEGSEMVFGLECTHWRHVRQRDRDRVWWEEFGDAAALRHRYRIDVLLAEGHRAQSLLQYEAGTHLFVSDDGRIDPVQAVVVPVAEGRSHWATMLETIERHERAVEAAAQGETADDPLEWRPTVSLHGPGNFISDLQSGSATWSTLSTSLPLPPEFRDWSRGQS